jgi:hypothetical protein
LVPPDHGNIVAAPTDSCGYGGGNLVAQTFNKKTYILLPVVGEAFLWIRRIKVAFRRLMKPSIQYSVGGRPRRSERGEGATQPA